MNKTTKIIIAATAAAVMALVSCQKVNPAQEPNEDPTVNEGQAANEERVITVTFTPQTKTTLDGVQPKFTNGDKILVANGRDEPDTCQVSVSGGAATFKTKLAGLLTAVYPAKAAKMKDDKNIEGVFVSTVQDGTFASANICMAENILTEAEFQNQTVVFSITPPTTSTEYVEVISTGLGIANSVPSGETTYTNKKRIHVATTPETAYPVYVSILVPSGLKISDLSFTDCNSIRESTDNTELATSALYTVGASGWYTKPYVEIKALYNGIDSTTLRWYKQNLAITDSGKKKWKGENTETAVKVPGTDDEDVIVGDYFQWGAHENYCGNASDANKGLLIYTAFNNTKCVGDIVYNFIFKSATDSTKTYRFNTSPSGSSVGISPYYSDSTSVFSKYTKTTSSEGDGKNILERTPDNDDVASIILGGDWRMPTTAEFYALYNATYWVWVEDDCGYYVFTPDADHTAGTKGNAFPTGLGKSDALLFFPAARNGRDASFNGGLSEGFYWSSSLYYSSSPKFAYCLYFGSGAVTPQYQFNRYYGFSVRPVSD